MDSTEAMMVGPAGMALAHETIELMSGHGVPACGENYEVWLAYRLSLNADLKQAIDSRIRAGLGFNDEVNRELYQRFFDNSRAAAAIMSATERIARDLHAMVGAMQGTAEKTSAFGKTLEVAAIKLEHGLDSERLREIISSLAASTIDMAAHNRSLTENLQRSTREIEGLRASLASVRAESMTDGLTGLANRRMFDETLRARVGEARAHSADLCLMLCDIDFFKRFNDTWGHLTGDQILRFVAATLCQHVLPDHVVARYGGEEFGVIMPRTGASAARSIAEALRMAIQNKRLRRRSTNEELGQVTVSIGVARLRAGETMEALIERADACLYESKRAGRNQTTTDSAPALSVA
ncbi:MAG: diguanylate cyclase [Alphaproteobacteria bacterium]|nr:diguanylate cyclase [Alphaproteobacteria bacterium]